MIAMPVYNAGPHLRLALLSIIRQSFSDWELLLIDDGSTDGSVDAVADILDSRIRVIQDGRNLGLAARLNQAIDMARGRYFARMDQDDISHPERLARQVALLESDPSLDVVATRCLTISEDNRILELMPWRENHEDICRRPWLGFYLPHPTWMGKTTWFRAYRYASPAPYFCEDQELLLRAHLTSRFRVIPQVLLAYRVRDRLNLKKAWRTRKTLYGFQCRYFMGKGQFHNVVLASGGFFLRVAKDVLAAIRHEVLGRTGPPAPSSALPEAELAAWQNIIQGLQGG
jgi:glycosyltransferase involved in cell wall biosynthesis